MPLKPCLKSGPTPSSFLSANNYPPIPIEQDQVPSSYFDYSPLPYAQPFVHFPPTPTLTSTYVVDPPRLYDRTPIVVTENECRLPQRGCPGRTYDASDMPTGDHAHPSKAFRHSQANSNMQPIPGLAADEGSSSDSDGLASPPSSGYRGSMNIASPLCHSLCSWDRHSPLCHMSSIGRDTDPRTFLPYPPSSHRPSHPHSPSVSTNLTRPSPRKTRSTRVTPSFVSELDSSSCLGGF